MTCTDIEARLTSILASRSTPTDLAPAEPAASCGRYDGDGADPYALFAHLRSWEAVTTLVDQHVETGGYEPYLTAIGRARLASGVNVVVAKRAVDLLVARRDARSLR